MSAVVCKTKYTNALTAKWIPLELVDTAGDRSLRLQYQLKSKFCDPKAFWPLQILTRNVREDVSLALT